MGKKTPVDPNFYRLPKNPEWTFVIVLMFTFYLALYRPQSTILDYLGPLGTFVRHMHNNHLGLLYNILYAAVAAHVVEAAYTLYLCRKMGINLLPTMLWVTQNFIFGFPSLNSLTNNRLGVTIFISLDFLLNLFVLQYFL